jgi:phosphohistidine phosphatase
VSHMLWLLRHAEAADGTPDDARPLTDRGVRQATDAGQALVALQAQIDACLGLELGEPFDVQELVAATGDVLLVGHDPSFTLLLHDLTGAQARMRKGGVAAIAKGELVTLLRPTELAAIAAGGRTG